MKINLLLIFSKQFFFLLLSSFFFKEQGRKILSVIVTDGISKPGG